MTKKQISLLSNSRFYILAASVLTSLIIIGWLRLNIATDRLFYIRTQQVFGLLALIYWFFALSISPLGYVIGKQRVAALEFARRAIGVSAFYFALLHGVVALWGQFGGISGIWLLPDLFQWSLLAGSVGFMVLTILALTSFDKVVTIMTFRRWKLLHRLTYLGFILSTLHIWTIGTHLAYSSYKLLGFSMLVALAGLETSRIMSIYSKKHVFLKDRTYFLTIFVSIWTLFIVAIAAMPFLVQNYHSRHIGAGHSET